MSESRCIVLEGSSSIERDLPFEIHAKGINFRTFFSVLRRLRGEDVVTRTLRQLPDPIRDAIQPDRIRPSEWQPISWYRELHLAACVTTGEGPSLSRLIGYEAVKEDLTGPLRALAFVLSPQAVIRRGPRIFRTYYRPGEMYVLEARPGTIRAQWSGCSGFNLNLWQDMIGGCEGVLRVCGAQRVDIRVISGAGDSDSRAEVLALWS